MANTKSSDQKQAPSIIEVAAASIDFAWDYTPVERALCCRLFAEQAIQGLRAAGYVIVPLEPTDEMTKVGQDWLDREEFSRPWDANECWRVMVGAAR